MNDVVTLEQVRDWHRKEARAFRWYAGGPWDEIVARHKAMAEAIDAHLAKPLAATIKESLIVEGDPKPDFIGQPPTSPGTNGGW
ncbi:MAG: hypothetical protein WA777_04750 [Rhodanobacter sp.]